jgi:hypothetical protein
MADKIKERVGEEMEDRLPEAGEHVRKRRAAHPESGDETEQAPRSASNRGDGAPNDQQ